MTKQTICAVPWMHLNFEPNGKVIPCCLTSVHNYFAGDLKTQSIEEIWNSDNMKMLRERLLNEFRRHNNSYLKVAGNQRVSDNNVSDIAKKILAEGR